MKIALLGYGTVGKSVEALLAERCPDIRIKKILRRPGKGDGARMTEDFSEILNDPEIDCIAEALSGTEPALTYIKEALAAGKHVVSANKAALAADFPTLLSSADKNGVFLLCEASCGGGIPWLENIKKAALLDRITALSGVLNGTGNYILDRMEREGLDFPEILRDAQALGYAEADPTADIGGFDIRNKALISCSLAYEGVVSTAFPVCGIEALTKETLAAFLAKGKHLRLMMLSVRDADDRYALGVAPVLLPADSIEANVRSNYNCAALCGDFVGTLKFYGQGAGGFPTADAVVQDLLQIAGKKAASVSLSRPLAYAPELLWGTGYFVEKDGLFSEQGTLSALSARAHKAQCFMAFEPAEGLLP